MKNKNLYEILGLETNASKEEIKLSYRKLVRIYHPDVNPTKEAEVYFKLLNSAVDTLLDDVKRESYDTLLGIKNSKKDKTVHKEAKETFNEKDPKKEHKDKYEQKPDNESTFIKGKDLSATVIISENEAENGTARKINILHTEKCPKCLGRKFINGSKCSFCKGVGEKSIHKKVSVKIPKNVKQGTKIKLEGMGEAGKFGAANGDLYLIINIEPERKEKFEGDNIITEVSITPSQAVLGCTIKVPLKGVYTKITIPPLTKTMTRFKLMTDNKSEPLANLHSNYIVVVKIDTPGVLSDEEVELYKKLRDIETNKV